MYLTEQHILSFDLSSDEGGSVWRGDFMLADRDTYAAVQLRDRLSLRYGGDLFTLVVDGKTLGREFGGETYRISVVSPLALSDAPFAATRSVSHALPTLARSIVEAQLGAVDWQLPEWSVPAGSCAFDKATPLAIAKAVVESVGGVVESNPDGSVVCRLRHPVAIPDYSTTAPALVITDADLLGSSEQLAARALFNAVAVSNTSPRAAGDRLDYVEGVVRGYPDPWRKVQLLHSGGPQVRIKDDGVVVRVEKELVEFVNGQSTTRYDVLSLVAFVWQKADLGLPVADGKVLSVAGGGYSLLEVSYETRAFEWRVYDTSNEEVQFILMDA